MLKSKTIGFSVILAVLGVLEMQIHLVQEQLGEYYGALYIAIAVCVAGLRAVTTTSLGDK